ncbi:MAG: tetratricopeptide repeat protein [Bacteroidota bacterium]
MLKAGKIIKCTGTLLFFLLFCYLRPFAQSISVKDSLFVENIVKEAKVTVDEDPEKAEESINRVLTFSKNKHYRAGLANCYNVLGIIYNRKSEYKKAILYYNDAKDIATEDHLESVLSAILYNKANVYENLSDYDNAFKTSEEALALKRKLNDSIGISRCYRQIGQYLSYKGDYQGSISYFKKALVMQKKLNQDEITAKTMNSMGVVYTNAKMYHEGLAILREAQHISENRNDSLMSEHIYLNLGFCYDGLLKQDSAEYYYLKSLAISKALDVESEKVIVLNNLGELALKQNKFSVAENYLTDALVAAQKINSIIDLKYIQSNLAELYARMGDYKRAYYFKEQYTLSSDSLMNEEKMRAVEETAIKFETKEIEEENKLLQKDVDLQKTRLEQKNFLILAIILFSALIMVILFLYIRQNKFKSQKQNLAIEQKLLQIQMNPHFIFNSLQAIQSFILTNRQKESSGYLTSFSRLMRLILENSKHEFISLDKEIDTLTYYLELQQLRFKEVFKYEIMVDSSIDKEFTLVPPMLLQPFIENAIEHGFKGIKDEGILNFNVRKANDILLIEIIDNGIGIEKSNNNKQSAKSKHNSYALEIIRKRIDIINQKLKIIIKLTIEDLSAGSDLKQGTKISLYIPTIVKPK